MELEKFLVDAKKNTYASQSENNEVVKDDGSRTLIFERKNIVYKDTYYGVNPFIGEEIVLKDHNVIWVMNYYGQVVSPDVNIKEIYGFLKSAMRKVTEESPFRGQNEYIENDYKYTNCYNGTIDRFSGEEKIFYKNKKVYTLIYHGCSIV